MNPISRAAGAVTHPVRTVGAVAGTALGLAMTGARTAAHLAGWVVERTFGQAATQPSPWRDTTDRPATAPVDGLLGVRVRVPDPAPAAEAPLTTAPATRTATKKAATKPPAKKAPARKAPAKQAPAKQAPAKQAPAKKAPAKKAPAKKAPAKKAPAKKAPAKQAPAKQAPSRQAAVVAPALGLSEDEVLEVLDDAAGPDEG